MVTELELFESGETKAVRRVKVLRESLKYQQMHTSAAMYVIRN